MAFTDFTIDETFVGQSIGPEDGYLVNLWMTTPPSIGDGSPRWSEDKLKWLSSYLTLRGSLDFRDLISFDPFLSNLVADGSISFRGALVVVACPRGSVWSLTLSDVPNVRTPLPPSINFSGSNYKPTNRSTVIAAPPRRQPVGALPLWQQRQIDAFDALPKSPPFVAPVRAPRAKPELPLWQQRRIEAFAALKGAQ